MRFIAALLFSLAFITPARAATFEAEDMSAPPGSVITHPVTASGGQALAFLENGTATQSIGPAESITVRARGGIDCAGFPHLSVTLDGSPLFDTTLGSYGWTKTTVPGSTSGGELGLTFDNALTTPDCQRILRVDVVKTSEPAADEPWRAFADDSIWNTPAGPSQPNPNTGLFTSYDPGLILGGGPAGSSSHDAAYRKPLFFAAPGDPCVPLIENEPSWVSSSSGVKVDRCIPVPHGVQAAEGSDGHLSVVNADRTIQWQMWRCIVNGNPCNEQNVLAAGHYQSTDGSQWDLTGSGVQSCCGSAGGRGSGTPIITTTLTPEDARDGVQHVLGVTVPNVSSSYVYPPASKSDGSCGCAIKYGQRYVLRADYPETGSVGRVNVLRGLKTYGLIVVDQGASFEIDTSGDSRPGEEQAWADVGLDRTALNDIRPGDLRYVP